MNIDEKLEESIENKYMKNDKDKNKMELTIEESVYILKRRDFNAYVEKIAIETLLTAYEKEKEKKKEYNMRINNLISQIENAIDFMKTDKSEIKVDLYKQKEEDLRLEIVHLKRLLKEE